MRARISAALLACGLAGAVLAAPAVSASTTAPVCPSGHICLWSGPNYTGTMAVLADDEPSEGCETAASLGLVGIRSAIRNNVPCSVQAALHRDSVCGRATEPAYVGELTPNVSPAALSLYRYLIPC